MLYQKILMGKEPYRLLLGQMKGFAEHRHADIELNYCIKGSFDIEIDKRRFCVRAGEMSLVGSMVSHTYLNPNNEENLVLTAIVGPTFLRENFGVFSQSVFSSPIYCLTEPEYDPLRELLIETAELCRGVTTQDHLLRTGNMYKICAYLLDLLHEGPTTASLPKIDLRAVEKIEKALELIHYRYGEPLTIDDAAAVTGYGKSNFCKIFKSITGESFHRSLNRRRVDVSRILLNETDMSVSAIAQEVGFAESKTYCRIFKAELGLSPGMYRKQNIRE